MRYVDPITGTSFDYQSESLDDVVRVVLKAKDEIYFKGYAAEPSATNEDKSDTTVANPPPNQDASPPKETEKWVDPHDYEDDDNPYGHWF
jgi:hypothetical protein